MDSPSSSEVPTVQLLPSSGLLTDRPPPSLVPTVGQQFLLEANPPQCQFRLPHADDQFSKRYGSVFTVHLGPQKVVVLSGFRTVKEALVQNAEEFGERNPQRIIEEFMQGHGIIWANGELWRDMRCFAISKLKDFGMGRRSSEDKIIEECVHLIELLTQSKGEAFNVYQSLNIASANIVCSLIYGNRFEYDDPEFRSLVDRACRNNTLMFSFSVQMYNLFPWIGKWFPGTREFQESFAANRKHHLGLIRRCHETLDPQSCRGFVDAFLVHKSILEESGITNSHFHEENLLITILNLFAGGTDTAALTLKRGLELMAGYPKIQDQVHEEVSRVIGERQVRTKDMLHLPFTNAVVHEIQRLAAIAPLALPRRVTKNITFQGHFIRKGTTIFPFLLSVLRDESEWEHPNTFYPAHFLDKDGKFVKRKAFLPFSAGQRICPGESLGKMELFILFCTLIQHFRFTPPPGVSEEELNLGHSSGYFTPSLKLCAVPRM
ncbi:cytochrome P450 2K4-like [Pholidichthys leucotaenia]